MAVIVSGATRGRPGRWIVDWRDALGRRRITTCASHDEAERQLGRAKREAGMRRETSLDPKLTVAELLELWKDLHAPMLRPQSRACYDTDIRTHILPAFGSTQVASLTPLAIERWAVNFRTQGYAKATAIATLAILRAALGVAVRHRLLLENPASAVGREIQRQWRDSNADRAPKALDSEQLRALLAAAKAMDVDLYEQLAILADTAARAGEALALRWEDVSFETRTLTFRRNASRHEGITPNMKTTASAAEIQLPQGLVDLLRSRRCRARAQALATGVPCSPWILAPEWGTTSPSALEIRRAYLRLSRKMRQAGKAAGLPDHFTLHSLRHSYCSRALADGLPAQWVQQQARHATITTTVDTYGSWLAHHRPAALDGLGAIKVSP